MTGSPVPPRRPAAAPSKVEIPRALLGGLLALLVICLAGIGFLAGRESVRDRSAPGSSVPPTWGSDVSRDPSRRPATAYAPLAETATVGMVASPRTEAPNAEPSPPAPPAAVQGPAETALKDQVAHYLRETELIQMQAKTWSDPEALARTILEQSADGDSSGFDRLIASTRKVRESIQSLRAPAPCQEHQRLTLTILDGADSLLTHVRDRILAGDTAALSGVPGRARELESKTREADRMAAQLKRDFAITP